MGSGGAYLGQRIARRLGVAYIDREILSRLTERFEEDIENLAHREERVTGFLESILSSFLYGSPEAPYVPPPVRPVYDMDLFAAEAEIIEKTAQERDAVIVGRAGFHVLRHYEGLINIFCHGPEDFRVRRIMEGYGIADPGEALALIRKSDSERRRFLEVVAKTNWTDARNYHLCMDTALTGFDLAEEMVVSLAEEVKASLFR
jgi:cytidylate kinase